jgi:mono/diheme cytochrome c family protein
MNTRGCMGAFGTLRVLAVAAAIAPVCTLAQPLAGNTASGRQIATTVCAACHQIVAGGQASAVGAPSFVDVANMPSTTALSLRVFLRSSHKKMPNFIISESDTNDLIAYILDLRQQPGSGQR